MESILALERELDYLNIMTDDVYIESDESDDSKIDKIKTQFNSISNHLDSAIVYTQSYVDDKTGENNDTDYEERLKAIIIKAQNAIDNNLDSMAVYDARSIYDKFNKCTDTVMDDLNDFITSRNYDNVDDVISGRDTILDIVKKFDDSMDNDTDVKVWINPQTVKRICENALSQGRSFNLDIKNTYMDIIRLNNKISNIVRDKDLDKDIKSEFISSSILCVKKVATFCINWNKYLTTHYPLTKA